MKLTKQQKRQINEMVNEASTSGIFINVDNSRNDAKLALVFAWQQYKRNGYIDRLKIGAQYIDQYGRFQKAKSVTDKLFINDTKWSPRVAKMFGEQLWKDVSQQIHCIAQRGNKEKEVRVWYHANHKWYFVWTITKEQAIQAINKKTLERQQAEQNEQRTKEELSFLFGKRL